MNKRWVMVLVIIIGIISVTFTVQYIKKYNANHPNPQYRARQYAYYQIVDQKTGENLMTISSSPVERGDELITGDNRLFRVEKVKGNKAYARFIKKVD